MPHAFQAARGGRQARGVVGGRIPAGAAGDVAVGAVPEADDDALPQPAGDGDRGAAALLPDRRRRADGRLRQDHAGAADGRVVDGPARRCSCRPGRCCAGTGAARRWGRGPTPGSTGRTCGPGTITQEDWQEIENGIARSPGHCMTMGTASTMTSAAEALGVTLPGAASIPAADSRHAVMGAHTGRRIVDMVWDDVQLSDDPAPAPRSATRSPRCSPSAARPTRSST